MGFKCKKIIKFDSFKTYLFVLIGNNANSAYYLEHISVFNEKEVITYIIY